MKRSRMRKTGRVTGVNRVALSAEQTRDTRNQDGELMAKGEDTGQRLIVEEERDMTMIETAGDTKMDAATLND